jgi:glucose-1-phosphate thymidylyltransferase
MTYTNKELKMIEDAQRLCMERDAFRCKHCGAAENLKVKNLVEKNNRLNWHLSNLTTLCEFCLRAAEVDVVENRVGIVLAGGKGKRLYPLTKYQNKHTLPISIIPMIFYPIKTLRSLGIKKVLIVVDRENSGPILEMLGSGREFGMDFSYRIQEGSGGISDALYLAKDFVRPEDQIFCILGDNIFDEDEIKRDFHMDTNSKACVFVKEVNNPQDYGVALIDNNKVVSIVEKPKSFLSNLAVLGLYIYTYDVFQVIENIEPSPRGELEISDVNHYYASQNELEYIKFNGYWADCGGSVRRYCEASLHGAKKANISAEEIDGFMSVVFDEK